MSDNWEDYTYSLTIYPSSTSDNGLSVYYWFLTALIPIFFCLCFRYCRKGHRGESHHHHHEDQYQSVDIDPMPAPMTFIPVIVQKSANFNLCCKARYLGERRRILRQEWRSMAHHNLALNECSRHLAQSLE